MAVPSPLLINSFNSLLNIYLFRVLLITSSFLAGLQQETALSETKIKMSHRCRLNYILMRFKKILNSATGFHA